MLRRVLPPDLTRSGIAEQDRSRRLPQPVGWVPQAQDDSPSGPNSFEGEPSCSATVAGNQAMKPLLITSLHATGSPQVENQLGPPCTKRENKTDIKMEWNSNAT